jgi:hypothetical protein
LTGLGFYALERRAQPLALKCLKRVLHHLEGTARPESGGFTWYTSPRYLPPAYRMKGPDGYSNLGVAHGVPGVISFLGSACACLEPSALPQARPLLEGGVAWLLKQKLAGASDAVFPFFTGPEVEPVPARTAWCYGDPGIAAALLHAALSAKEPSWKEEALGIARAAAERAPEKTGVLDAGLCHGAAGLAHLFNRMYQSTGETFLRNTAEYWFHRTLELRQPSEGIGGYRTWLAGESRWIFDPGFLTGSAGIGLVLLAAVSEVPPGWDRVLGLSGPPDWRSAAG